MHLKASGLILAMTTLLKPSALLPQGLQVQQINNLTLFKFTDELGERMQTLLDKKKADDLGSTSSVHGRKNILEDIVSIR
jgi:hypothetical protein